MSYLEGGVGELQICSRNLQQSVQESLHLLNHHEGCRTDHTLFSDFRFLYGNIHLLLCSACLCSESELNSGCDAAKRSSEAPDFTFLLFYLEVSSQLASARGHQETQTRSLLRRDKEEISVRETPRCSGGKSAGTTVCLFVACMC